MAESAGGDRLTASHSERNAMAGPSHPYRPVPQPSPYVTNPYPRPHVPIQQPISSQQHALHQPIPSHPEVPPLPSSSSSRIVSRGPSRKSSPQPPQSNQLEFLLTSLAHLRSLSTDTMERRRLKRSSVRAKLKENPAEELPKACVECRKAKTKCMNKGEGEDCARCVYVGLRCKYEELKKRGRKADDSIQVLLDDMEDRILSLLRGEQVDVKPMASTMDAEPSESTSHVALYNPLGVLVSAVGQIEEARRPQQGLYWNNIYSTKVESDFSQDPVLCGIIAESQLDMLIEYFMINLRPFFLHLDPVIHTTEFLRLNSPFLTTAICSVASSYHPTCHHLAPRLITHAHQLAFRAFADGSKSLEVVQAFLIMTHWAPCLSSDWADDKSWAFQGQAMRLCCEIRLDLPLEEGMSLGYRTSKSLTKDEETRLKAIRQAGYWMVSLSEIAMSTQSGRADTTSGHRLLREPNLPPESNDPPFIAVVKLNHIFARALHHWHGTAKEDAEALERDRFVRLWAVPLEKWKATWLGKFRLIDIYSFNTHIMLSLLSLRVRGSDVTTQKLLRQICELAVNLIVAAQKWYDETPLQEPGGLGFAHNILIVNIAYGAVLVHRLSKLLEKSRMIEVSARIEKIAVILERIDSARLSRTSFAGYYASQLRALLSQDSTHIPREPPVVSSLHQLPQGADAFDFSFLPLEDVWSNGEVDASISDPILSFLSGSAAGGTDLIWDWTAMGHA